MVLKIGLEAALLAAAVGFAFILYRDVKSLMLDPSKAAALRKSPRKAGIKLLITFIEHMAIVIGHGFILGHNYIAAVIAAGLVLFIPYAFIMSTPLIKTLGKGSVFISTGVVFISMLFLRLMRAM